MFVDEDIIFYEKKDFANTVHYYNSIIYLLTKRVKTENGKVKKIASLSKSDIGNSWKWVTDVFSPARKKSNGITLPIIVPEDRFIEFEPPIPDFLYEIYEKKIGVLPDVCIDDICHQ